MEENSKDDGKPSPEDEASKVQDSPKPLAFTIDFGERKSIDNQRHKALVEKYQNRHRRGQSLSKLEDSPAPSTAKKHPLSGNLPRKSSFISEGYFSSDEKSDRIKNVRSASHHFKARAELRLPLKNAISDKMTQSFPNGNFHLHTIQSPEIELKDVSSPELDLVSPFSLRNKKTLKQLSKISPKVAKKKIVRQFSTPEYATQNCVATNDSKFVDGAEFDFDKSDTVSDAGTYTIDTDNYSEEQKARMSIDREFNLEQIPVLKKAEEYVQSLSQKSSKITQLKTNATQAKTKVVGATKTKEPPIAQISSKVQNLHLPANEPVLPSPKSPNTPTLPAAAQHGINYSQVLYQRRTSAQGYEQKCKLLSPILSPTQNVSIVSSPSAVEPQNESKQIEETVQKKPFTKILFPSPKAKTGIGLEESLDQGCFTSVTASGAFSRKSENKGRDHVRRPSLTKSEIQVQTYTDTSYDQNKCAVEQAAPQLNHNGISKGGDADDMKNNEFKSNAEYKIASESRNFESDLVIAKLLGKITNLPPPVGGVSGKSSPSKIPSPVHSSLSRPRSRSSISSLNVDLSDSSMETESFLKPTQNYINSLQKRLSLDSDQDSDYDSKCNVRLNNETQDLMKHKPAHARHNSYDDRNAQISNKLEHFQNKNLQGIDQTYSNKFDQYPTQVNMHKIQNSPNNSPIRRSSSFSAKNQFLVQPKVSNLNQTLPQKDVNIQNSPSFTRNGSIQRSASTANIRPNILQLRRSSTSSEHSQIDRNQFADTESSSEDDYEKNFKKKDITNTRYNRAFSLRRARLDDAPSPKCPNTPEMRRKFLPTERKQERAISVDRRPMKTNDVQSRYMQNITKSKLPPVVKAEPIKNVPKVGNAESKFVPAKLQVFARTDSGRFSMRTSKPATLNPPKNVRKDVKGKKQSGGRCNSSLSSREVEFQNWKRRKSYDPMKAAAEGKRKAELAKKQNHNIMTQSYNENNQNQDCDSSPSHSSSVHRSQSFHGTAALEHMMSSDEDDVTLSADEGFSPPTPSPCELSPARAKLRHAWGDRLLQ